MRLRVLLEPHHGATYAQIRDLAQAAEQGGFDAFFRSDHYLGIDANDTTYQPTDSWTTLAGLALQTERVRIGTLVNASTFRLPGQLAVEVATVDQMSGGRAELGIGAAWYEREHQYFGIPFPPLGERFDRLEEQLAILTGIWDTRPGERFSFDGKHYQVQDCASIPRWASRPKIIIGGAGAKRTPTLAARYADEFNGALGLDVRERYANFRRICEDVVGRDPAEVRLSATLPVCIGSDPADLERRKESLGEPGARLLAAGVTGTAGDVIRAIEDLAGQGADTVYFHLYGPGDVEHVRLLGSEVVSRFLPAAVPPLPPEVCRRPWRPPVRHHNGFLAKLVGAGTCLQAFTVGVVRPPQGSRCEACRCGQMLAGIRSGSMRDVTDSAIDVKFRRYGN